ncbi:hypothetical protein [Leptothoe kymatousa]|uniref:Sulfotransferase n=1 Tax=Leptothoe kymatousa TAU-MAC 1615 TaxID=2364775 RepID=A0ABS5Y3V7_9CYAN|nr:hypothetical protein [Leptothoe kymatousa]MBT9312510.1 hypothetical protein [Leptothoe kymatousa TAU-MAC 1615]
MDTFSLKPLDLPVQKLHLRLKPTLNYLYRRPPLTPVRFILFGRGRSGTTALVSLLDAVAGIQCDGEILRRPVLLPQAYLHSCCAKSSAYAYGCKILSYHIRDVQPLLRRQRFLSQLDRAGFKIIYLQRRNLLHHAISNLTARVSGFYQKKTDGVNKHRKIVVDPEAVLDWIRRSERLAAYEQTLLKGLTVLPLTYEDNIRHSHQHQATVDAICEFLAVPSSPVTSAYRKQTSGRWQDGILNHQELAQVIANTPYAQYLQED